MREVEFRGYDPDTKRWYYGSYVRLERISPYPMSQTPEEDNKKHENEQIDHYIFFTEMNDWGLETKKLRATVDPKSVGQYIGLNRHGKRVYQGDIVGHWHDGNKEVDRPNCVVTWDEDLLCWSCPGFGNGTWMGYDFDILGNAYINQELVSE